jgi:hypothetical protein
VEFNFLHFFVILSIFYKCLAKYFLILDFQSGFSHASFFEKNAMFRSGQCTFAEPFIRIEGQMIAHFEAKT